MNWPHFLDFAASSSGGFLAGGIIMTLIQVWFHRPREQQLTEKEKALAEAARADISIEKIKLYMDDAIKLYMDGVLISNKSLKEDNRRLYKNVARLERENEALRKARRSPSLE